MWNVTPRRFLDGTPTHTGGVPPDVNVLIDPDTPPYTLDAILRHPDAVDLLLQNGDAFIQVVTRQDIFPRTLDMIFRNRDAVELLVQDRDAFIQVVARQDIFPHTLDVIFQYQDAVRLLRQNRDTLMRNPRIHPYLRRRLAEI